MFPLDLNSLLRGLQGCWKHSTSASHKALKTLISDISGKLLQCILTEDEHRKLLWFAVHFLLIQTSTGISGEGHC